MEPKIAIDNNLQVREAWSKPEIIFLGVKGGTMGTHSLHGSDVSFSS